MNPKLIAFIMTVGFAASSGLASPETEVRSAVAGLEQALRERGPAWVEHYTEDAVFVAPGEATVQGRAALLEMAQTMEPLREMKIAIERMEVNEDLGYTLVRGSWLTGEDPATQKTARVRSLLVWRRDPDGKWRVTQELLHDEPEGE